MLVGVVVPPSGVAHPQEEADSYGSMPALAPASEACDVPVPEEDSDDEDAHPSIDAGKVIKKLHDNWVDEDPSAFVPLLKSYKKEVIEFYLRPEELPNMGWSELHG